MTFIACLLVTRWIYPSRRSTRRRIDNRDADFSASDLAPLRVRLAATHGSGRASSV
jgi:hypothetical protein